MSEAIGFRCRQCGDGFVVNVLSPEEIAERQRLRLSCGPIRCPQCGSLNVDRVRQAA
jgi:transposase-like protein